MKILSSLMLVLCILFRSDIVAHPLQQEGETYIVQADDWLSKIAEKYYDDVSSWRAIWLATNTRAMTDKEFTVIAEPDLIEIGQKIWLPAETELETYLAEYENTFTEKRETSNQERSLGFESIEQGDIFDSVKGWRFFYSDEPVLFTIQTQSEFDEEFRYRHTNIDAVPVDAYPSLVIDWTIEMVVAVINHGEGTGGYQIQIERIVETEENVIVNAKKIIPGASCVVTQAITQPFHLVKISKSSKPFLLTLEVVTRECS